MKILSTKDVVSENSQRKAQFKWKLNYKKKLKLINASFKKKILIVYPILKRVTN